MKIVGLRIANLKNIEFIDLQLNEQCQLIAGQNGSGKTTVIEAIFTAIKGKTFLGKQPHTVIQHGKDKAVIEIVLQGEKRRIEIKRTITEDNVYLKATDEEGRILTQGHLDGLLSQFTIDPLAFSRLSPKEQIDVVKNLAGIDTSALEKAYDDKYNMRTEVGRDKKRLEGVLQEMGTTEDVEKINIQELISEKDTLSKKLQKLREAKAKKELQDATLLENLNKITQLEELIKQLKETNEGLNSDIQSYNKIIEKEKPNQIMVTLNTINEKLESAEKVNTKARKHEEMLKIKLDLSKVENTHNKIDQEMKDLIKSKKDMIESAKLPIDNVDFSNEIGLIINGTPFSRMSSGEQLKIATQLGTSLSPELKLIYIKDGSLLDDKNLNIIKEIANDKDYQILVEIVGEKEGNNVIVMKQANK